MGKIRRPKSRRPKSRRPKSRRSKAHRSKARRTKSSGKRRTFRKNCMKKCRRTCKQRGGGEKERRRAEDIAALQQDPKNLDNVDQEDVFLQEPDIDVGAEQTAIIKLLVKETPGGAEDSIKRMQESSGSELANNLDWNYIKKESERIRMQEADSVRDMSVPRPTDSKKQLLRMAELREAAALAEAGGI